MSDKILGEANATRGVHNSLSGHRPVGVGGLGSQTQRMEVQIQTSN